MIHLKIDPEFQSLIFPCDKEFYDQLEEDIFDYGCHTPIDTWQDTILDGHKRYAICQEYELPFQVNPQSFPNRHDAISAICRKQMERKDLPYPMERYLIGKIFEMKKILYMQENNISDNTPKKHGFQYRIAGIIGKEFNLAAGTVYKYGAYTQAIDNITSKQPDFFGKITSGKLKVSHDNIIELSRLTKEELGVLYRAFVQSQKSHINYSEIRNELRWHKIPFPSQKPKKAEPLPAIKELPEYDPDAEINSLSLTIPSWISSIERTENNADLTQTTEPARSKLLYKLSSLNSAIADMQKKLMEDNCHG